MAPQDYPSTPSKEPMALIFGDIGSGKTHLLGRIIQYCKEQGDYYLYMTSHGEGSKTLFEALGIESVHMELVEDWDNPWARYYAIKQDHAQAPKDKRKVLLFDDVGMFVGEVKDHLQTSPLNKRETRDQQTKGKAQWEQSITGNMFEGNRDFGFDGYMKLAMSTLKFLRELFDLGWDYIVLTARESSSTHPTKNIKIIQPAIEGKARETIMSLSSVNAWASTAEMANGDFVYVVTTEPSVTLMTRTRGKGGVKYISPGAEDIFKLIDGEEREMSVYERNVKLTHIGQQRQYS